MQKSFNFYPRVGEPGAEIISPTKTVHKNGIYGRPKNPISWHSVPSPLPKVKEIAVFIFGPGLHTFRYKIGIESKLHDWTGQGERGSARARACVRLVSSFSFLDVA